MVGDARAHTARKEANAQSPAMIPVNNLSDDVLDHSHLVRQFFLIIRSYLFLYFSYLLTLPFEIQLCAING